MGEGTAGPSGAAADSRPGEVTVLSAPQEIAFPENWYALCSPDHFWFQWRLRAFLSLARAVGTPLDAPLRALEVGGGSGVLCQQVEAASGWTVDITDLSLAALRRARPGRGRRLCYDVLETRPECVEAYDVVLLFDVLEHIEETGDFVRAAIRHLKPGGRLFVNVPALASLYGPYDVAAGHHRRYDPAPLAAELDGSDVAVDEVRFWGLSLTPLLVLRRWLHGRRPPTPRTIDEGFAPPAFPLHAALKAVMRVETALLPRPATGSSLLLAGRRRAGSPT